MKQFQGKFLAAILKNEIDSELLNLIEPVGTLSAEESIKVYQGDYIARMMEALGQNYEATWVLLGDEDFFALGKKYINTHPSIFKNLSTYGHHFDMFLEQEKVDLEVIQMAAFEKSFWKYFHQAPSKKIDIQDVEEVEFACDFYISHSEIGLYDLWLRRESPPDSLNDFLQEEYLCVFKKESKVEVQKISRIQYQLLRILKDTRSLNHAISKAEELELTPNENDWVVVLEICLWAN